MNTPFYSWHRFGTALRQTLGGLIVALGLSACSWPVAPDLSITRQRLSALPPMAVLLLGEQHDAPDHQRIEGEVVQVLASQGSLAALALEMADRGHSTAALGRDASDTEVRAALKWEDKNWPWRTYGPAVMAAVRAGVPVLGANLPHAQMPASLDNRQLDLLLKGPALKAQQQLIRQGHCGLLPEHRITALTRIQIARDISMAQTVTGAVIPGKTVLLLAGNGHVDRSLGVPQHLPPSLNAKSIGLQADAAQTDAQTIAKFDVLWPAQPAPEKDYCAEFKADRSRESSDTAR
jgi:uncharacterized iron-regulated protein